MKKKIYIAGPMSGYAEFNFPKFFAVEEKLKAEGWEVFNPANKEDEAELSKDISYIDGNVEGLMKNGFNFRKTFKWDVVKVISADAIYMLKGWEHSPGATGEHGVAVAMQSKYPEYEIIYEN